MKWKQNKTKNTLQIIKISQENINKNINKNINQNQNINKCFQKKIVIKYSELLPHVAIRSTTVRFDYKQLLKMTIKLQKKKKIKKNKFKVQTCH